MGMTEHNQPMLRSHAVICLFGDEIFVRQWTQAAEHPVPVFLGPGGHKEACEYLGSYRAGELLGPGHPLRQNESLSTMMQGLKKNSRRAHPEVHLLRLHHIENEVQRFPRHPLETQNPVDWAIVILARAWLATCVNAWRQTARRQEHAQANRECVCIEHSSQE